MTQSAIQEYLTQGEIGECLRRTFDALSEEDKQNLQPVIAELTKIPHIGVTSALRLIFAVDQAPALERLNEILQGG